MAVSNAVHVATELTQSHPFLFLWMLLLSSLSLWTVYTLLLHPLAGLPGPLLASFTRFWYVINVRNGNFDVVIRQLHRKYGYIVRIAPDEVSISDPDALPVVFSSKSGFTKTDFYLPWRSTVFKPTAPDNFTNLDEESHAARRRLTNHVFSMTSVLETEHCIDACSKPLIEWLHKFAKTGHDLDLGHWVQMYAFDVIGELFFGQSFGFMETGGDHNGYIASLDMLVPVLTVASVLPVGLRTAYLVSGTLFSNIRHALSCFGKIQGEAKRLVDQRDALLNNNDGGKAGRKDILAKLFAIHHDRGDKVGWTVADIQQESYVALMAGSDTTAIAMRSTLYQLMKSPAAYQRLLDELDEAYSKEALDFPVSYRDGMNLPYFMACCKEGMRLHPAVGLGLPRYVPQGGREIAGFFFAEGCRVQINASVIHFDKTIFGEDADEFNPSRWFRPDAALMERHMLHFGGGSRTCVGKNISLAEIYKVMPEMLYKFKFELTHPDRPLKKSNYWFNKQDGIIVKVHERPAAFWHS